MMSYEVVGPYGVVYEYENVMANVLLRSRYVMCVEHFYGIAERVLRVKLVKGCLRSAICVENGRVGLCSEFTSWFEFKRSEA